MMKLPSRMFVTMLLAMLFSPWVASSQDYPAKPVRVLIPWPPGGSNDVVGRIVFQKLSENLRRTFVIENRGGAAGTIGSDVVAKATPDGYTIMVHSTTHIANAYLYENLPYDTLADFAGVTPLARQVSMLVVHPSLPVKSVKELIALAKARPNEILYATAGKGSALHLTMSLLISMTGIDMVHVPYKGGGPATIALISGEAQAVIGTIGSFYPHIKAGRVRPVAVTAPERVNQFPDVPAIAETIPGYDFVAWVGCFAPARTPRAIVERLNAELHKVLRDPMVAATLTKMTLDPMFMTPEEFDRRLRADYEKYGRLVKLAGVGAD